MGAFAVLWLLDLLGRGTGLTIAALASLGLAGISLGASTLHLGRPIYAWRALKGLRRSWLSREVLTLSLFAGAASAFAGMLLFDLPGRGVVGMLTFVAGLAGVTCSARIYVVRARPAWFSGYTLAEFYSTALLLGPLFVQMLDGGVPSWVRIAAIAGASSQLITQLLKVPVAFALGSVRAAGFVAAAFGPLAESVRDPAGRAGCRRRPAAAGCDTRVDHRSGLRGGARGRMARALPVLRERGPQEHGRGVHLRRKESRMNWKRTLGLDNLSEEYAFARERIHRLHFGQKDSGPLGAHHVRLLFGRLRDRDRREGWPRRRLPAVRTRIR